jgi:hypothetical protein
MTKFLSTAMLLAFTIPALAGEPDWNYRTWGLPDLFIEWGYQDNICRGPYGTETDEACDKRSRVDDALFAKGWCFVGKGSTSRWEKGPASRWTRRGELAFCHSERSSAPELRMNRNWPD